MTEKSTQLKRRGTYRPCSLDITWASNFPIFHKIQLALFIHNVFFTVVKMQTMVFRVTSEKIKT